MTIFSKTLNCNIEVSPEGMISLPSGDLTSSQLKQIAREVNKAYREQRLDQQYQNFDE